MIGNLASLEASAAWAPTPNASIGSRSTICAVTWPPFSRSLEESARQYVGRAGLGRDGTIALAPRDGRRFFLQMRTYRRALVHHYVKGDKLGEFEEFALLALHALKDETYGVPVQQYMEKHTGRSVTMGAVYAALARLEEKGYVRSILSDPTPVRGGKRKRHYQPTAAGIKALQELQRVRERMWQAIESRGRA